MGERMLERGMAMLAWLIGTIVIVPLLGVASGVNVALAARHGGPAAIKAARVHILAPWWYGLAWCMATLALFPPSRWYLIFPLFLVGLVVIRQLARTGGRLGKAATARYLKIDLPG